VTVEERIREFVLTGGSWHGSPEELTLDYPLIDRQVLDSLAILKLISLLEDDLGVEVADEDLAPENFGTIRRIVDYVEARS
jgi:acyl carrier protein